MKTISPVSGAALICSLFVIPLSAMGGDTFPTCSQAWRDAPASKSCLSLGGGSAGMPAAAESGFRSCIIKVNCTKGNGTVAPNENVTVDITQVRDLNNCDGRLKVGGC